MNKSIWAFHLAEQWLKTLFPQYNKVAFIACFDIFISQSLKAIHKHYFYRDVAKQILHKNSNDFLFSFIVHMNPWKFISTYLQICFALKFFTQFFISIKNVSLSFFLMNFLFFQSDFWFHLHSLIYLFVCFRNFAWGWVIE